MSCQKATILPNSVSGASRQDLQLTRVSHGTSARLPSKSKMSAPMPSSTTMALLRLRLTFCLYMYTYTFYTENLEGRLVTMMKPKKHHCITTTFDPSSPSLQPSAALSAWPDLRNHVTSSTWCRILSSFASRYFAGLQPQPKLALQRLPVFEFRPRKFKNPNKTQQASVGKGGEAVLKLNVFKAPENAAYHLPNILAQGRLQPTRLSSFQIGGVCQWHLWQYVYWEPVDLSPQDS